LNDQMKLASPDAWVMEMSERVDSGVLNKIAYMDQCRDAPGGTG
jgi:hypothetical protein